MKHKIVKSFFEFSSFFKKKNWTRFFSSELLNGIKIENQLLNHLTDEELNSRIDNLKKIAKLSHEKIYTDEFICKWFAMVQEISFRKISLKHFDNQLLAGLYLSKGKIVEMKTGEGKTLVSTLPASLNALEKKGVHVVTVNEYLAERDEKLLSNVYQNLGLTSGLIKNSYSIKKKKKGYFADITYVSNSELVFDYLATNSSYTESEKIQRSLHYCLIDEVDSILIDESRVPLIKSDADNSEESLLETIIGFSTAKALVSKLEKDIDFILEEKNKQILLTEIGNQKIQKYYKINPYYTLNTPRISELLNFLKAKYFFKKDRDYLILNNKICLIDQFTGRVSPGKKWSEGLQEAIESKENLVISTKSKTQLSITYPNFFLLYPKCSGMTGTAKTSSKEFKDIYGLKVKEIKPRKKLLRKDLFDLVYLTEKAKWNGAIRIIKNCFLKGQPILIGTLSVEKSELLSELLQLENLSHTVLNAKPENTARENEIIALAGERYSITIATNMAGRGTDILLGGNPTFKTKNRILQLLDFSLHKIRENYQQESSFEKRAPIKDSNKFIKRKKKTLNHLQTPIFASLLFLLIKKKSTPKLSTVWDELENLPYSLDSSKKELKVLYKTLYSKAIEFCNKENKFVKKLGGLFVLGTERNETRRLDNQLRGRAGRQGDPGISQVLVSLEDDLIRLFGNQNLYSFLSQMNPPIRLKSSFLNYGINLSQKRIENFNYEIRKELKKYDDIINIKRQLFFELRNAILAHSFSLKFFLHLLSLYYVRKETKKQQKQISLKKKQSNYENLQSKLHSLNRKFELKEKKFEKPYSQYTLLWKIWWGLIEYDYSKDSYLGITKSVFLQKPIKNLLKKIDDLWQSDITRMDNFKETIQLKSYTGTYIGIDILSEFRLMNYITYFETYDSILETLYTFNQDPFSYNSKNLNLFLNTLENTLENELFSPS